jgi:hypothetical protein
MMVLWGLKGDSEFTEFFQLFRERRERKAFNDRSSSKNDELPKDSSDEVLKQLAGSISWLQIHQNEWDLLPSLKKLQIWFLLLDVKIPPKIPEKLRTWLQSRHVCTAACSSTCSSRWPTSFASKLDKCPFCQNTELGEKKFSNVVLLDDMGIFFDRKILVQ